MEFVMSVSLIARPAFAGLLVAVGIAAAASSAHGQMQLTPPAQQGEQPAPRPQRAAPPPRQQQPARQQPAAAPQQPAQSRPAPAQEQAALPPGPRVINPNPSNAAVAMAREVIVMKGANQMFEAVVPGVIEQAKNMFIPTNPQLGSELNEVATLLRKEYETKKSDVLNEVARSYARRFGEQDLKELLAFYKSNLGKKVLAEEPLAIEDSMKRAQEWANEFSEQMITRMRAEMKKKGHDL
jgi:hypothetical protein